MRLKKLTMQAFGPFKDKMIIDFVTNKIDQGLLLITGDTGAGKTTIFDAISFALYGESSGEVRKINSFRSDWASPEVETFVELEFYHNHKEYTVKRSPEYMRKSKRGDGFTKQPATAEFEINGRKEVKTTTVTNEITSLIGLDYKQFRQVAMLSQGEFTKFLLASSDEKTSIFRKIFGTALYSNIMLKLKEDLVLKEQTYNQTKANIEKTKGKLENINYEALTNEELIIELDKKIEDKSAKLETVRNKREQLNENVKKKTVELNEIEKTNQKIDTLETKKENLKVLNENNQNIEEEKNLLEYNINVVPKIKNVMMLIEKEEKTEKEHRENLQNCYLKLENINKQKKVKEEEFKKLETFPDRLESANNIISKITEDIKKYENYNRLTLDFSKNQEQMKISFQKYEQENKKLEQMRKEYYLNEAFLLSETLEEGKACPVCGSKEHPHKAIKQDNSYDKEDIERQNHIVSEAFKNNKIYETRYESLMDEINELNVDENIDVDKLLSELIVRKENETKNLMTIKAEYETLSKEKNKLASSLIELNKEIEIHESTIEKAKLELHRLEKELSNIYHSYQTNKEIYEKNKLEDNKRKELEEKIKAYDNEKNSCTSIIDMLSKELEGKVKVNIEEKSITLKTLTEEFQKVDEVYLSLNNQLEKLKENTKEMKEYVNHYKKELNEYQIIKGLSDTANGKLVGKQRITFENYVQSYYLNSVLTEANKRLSKMTDGRYDLRRKEVSSTLTEKLGLEFSIFDAYTGKEREVSSLSGGEKFKAALSLALGLSDSISMYAGGIKIDALFVDEGFGSLDAESLNQALNTLSDLATDDKLVGIISHVSELISRIDKKIVVKKNSSSTLEIES